MGKRQRYKPSLFWPMVLIGVGVVLLLSNLGILPPNSINVLLRFWPIGLVIIGLDMLLGRRSAIGSIVTAFLVLAVFICATGMVIIGYEPPEFFGGLASDGMQHASVSTPRNEIETAAIRIDWASQPAKLFTLSDSANLIEGNIDYQGDLDFNVNASQNQADVALDSHSSGLFFPTININDEDAIWEVGLHPGVALDLTLDAGSGPGEYDLADLNIEAFNIDGGSGPLTITLPDSGRIDGTIDGGSGPITLIVPETTGIRISLNEGSGPFVPSGRFSIDARNGDNVVWVTDGYDRADNAIELELDGGSGPIEVKSLAK